jgi:hypothetical protein
MAYNLNDYFQLGLDSEATPQNSLVMNTIRTPVDVQSGRSGLSKVTFKVPKVGLLTGDSMLTFQFKKGTATSSNATPNFITGALGCIERVRIVIDNKELTNLERPSLLEVPKIYSRNTQNEVAQFNYKFLANQFQTGVNDANGEEEFAIKKTRYFSDATETADLQNVVRYRVDGEDTSHVYGIHLKHLGAQFLENRSLPVFLLGAREMILEVFFYKDCREYLVPTQGTIGADSYEVNYPNVELVSTHIQIPDDVQANEIANLSSKPVNYPLLDNYLVKGTNTTPVINTAKEKIFRVNAQNRELHKLLICNTDISANIASDQRVVANQKALSLGDVRLQIKSNGLNLYERPLVNPSILYQQTTYAHNGMALKLPYGSFNVDDRVNQIPQTTQTLYTNYRGTQQYLAVDFQNGNGGVFGGGSIQRQAMEVEYQVTPRVATNPVQVSRQVDVNFYLAVSKMLTIGARNVDISF